MSKHHVTAIFNELSWLNDYFGEIKEGLANATVERADLKTLESKTGFRPLRAQNCYSRSQLYLFDQKGSLIYTLRDGMRWYHRLIRFIGADGPNFGYSSLRSVQFALLEIGERIKDCGYIVEISSGSGPYESYLTMIRKPKDRTFLDLLKEKEEKDLNDDERAREDIKKNITP